MHYQLRKPVTTIGRDPRSDIPLPGDTQVSKVHAEIRREGVYFVIYDLNSTNGTFVNGQRVSRQVLKEADEIRVGRTRLVFQRGALVAPGVMVPRQLAPAQLLWVVAAGVALVLVVLAMVLSVQTRSPIERAQRATVMVLVLDEWDNLVSMGSGSIVDPQGLVLTNFHVVGDLYTGDWYHPLGTAYIGITTEPDHPPAPWYLAEVVQEDTDLDLAVLRIVADRDGNPIRGRLNLNTIPLGNSDSVRIGDKLSILGYPAVGMVSFERIQATITYAEGVVSGFFTLGNVRMWIKTDIEINEGNSGGLAINGRGELVGIPTWHTPREWMLGEVGGIRPVNLARHLVEAAQIELRSIP